MNQTNTIVLKFGGSVLRDELHVRAAADEVARFVRNGQRVVAVVSAIEGTTDALLARAKQYAAAPEPFATAQLLSTGELQSAALLGLALDAVGIRSQVFDATSAGLRTEGEALDASPIDLDTETLRRAFDHARAIVVPGFVGRSAEHRTTVLGRGGSDLTALFIADRLGAGCRLIKDVDGLYEWDPALPGDRPRRFASLPWDEALQLDGTIVQHKAVRFARERQLAFEVGTFAADNDVTRIGDLPSAFADEGECTEPATNPNNEPIHAA